MKDNICRENGYGWGSAGRVSGAVTMQSCGISESVDVDNFVIQNNCFDRSAGLLLDLHNGGDEEASFNSNTYIQTCEKPFAHLFGTVYNDYPFDSTTGETNAKIVKVK